MDYVSPESLVRKTLEAIYEQIIFEATMEYVVLLKA